MDVSDADDDYEEKETQTAGKATSIVRSSSKDLRCVDSYVDFTAKSEVRFLYIQADGTCGLYDTAMSSVGAKLGSVIGCSQVEKPKGCYEIKTSGEEAFFSFLLFRFFFVTFL